MATDTSAVLRDGLALPEEERAKVAAELFASLEGPDEGYSPEEAERWAREIERRVERIAAGATDGVPLDEALAEVKARLADG